MTSALLLHKMGILDRDTSLRTFNPVIRTIVQEDSVANAGPPGSEC